MNKTNPQHRENWTGMAVAEYLIARKGLTTQIKPLSALPFFLRILGNQYSFHRDTIYLSQSVRRLHNEKSVAIAVHEVGHAMQKHKNFTALGMGARGWHWIDRWYLPVFLLTTACLGLLFIPYLILQVLGAAGLFFGLMLCSLLRPYIDCSESDASKRGMHPLSTYDPKLGMSLIARLDLDDGKMWRFLSFALATYRLGHLAIFSALAWVIYQLLINLG